MRERESARAHWLCNTCNARAHTHTHAHVFTQMHITTGVAVADVDDDARTRDAGGDARRRQEGKRPSGGGDTLARGLVAVTLSH